MKRLLAIVIIMGTLTLVGCENVQLMECQEQNAALQKQLSDAKANMIAAQKTITQKDNKISALEEKNIEDQNTAMQSITTMMTKQAEKDKELKQKLADKTQQVRKLNKKVTDLEKQIAEFKSSISEVTETTEEQM